MHKVTILIEQTSSYRGLVLKWIKMGGGVVEDSGDPDKIVADFDMYEKAREVAIAIEAWQDSLMLRRN